MNRVTITGRLTKDIELRYTKSNEPIASFNIAVNRGFKNSNGEYEADFPNCVAYRGIAKALSNYCHKGDLIGIDGEIRTRSYQDNNGVRKYVTEIFVNKIDFLSVAKKTNTQSGQVDSQEINEQDPFASFGEEVQLTDDDLPFMD